MDTNHGEKKGRHRIAPGEVINPEGKNGHTKHWQPYGIRAKHWLDKLTFAALRALSQDIDEMDKLSSYDAIIIRHLANTLSGDDIRQEREALLDRIEGKPKTTLEMGAIPGGAPIQVEVTRTVVRPKSRLDDADPA